LPKLLPYRRLKIFATFAAVGSLESVGMQQLRQYATTLGVSTVQNRIYQTISILTNELRVVF
jgi:hypothetical protein